ncbi:uncharacterized protein FFB20_05599 [Fusarium fujikuroi]|nr:uncharacterized protein FFB20_05599 [Fusarium fujikuroi]SCO19785.1 uncharacterized protein FFE2_14454 [Fusarium fujikuroi]SCO25033.1 uncharacterized protein FFC1_15305 [Fusarium fujikuroi]SCO52738.1 uncharacterized protein FFNC_14459 [Fusarium fujikuroi]SCV60072.1 uncharacterized protein FFFS_14641 [Fusarium fujikuroi]
MELDIVLPEHNMIGLGDVYLLFSYIDRGHLDNIRRSIDYSL